MVANRVHNRGGKLNTAPKKATPLVNDGQDLPSKEGSGKEEKRTEPPRRSIPNTVPRTTSTNDSGQTPRTQTPGQKAAEEKRRRRKEANKKTKQQRGKEKKAKRKENQSRGRQPETAKTATDKPVTQTDPKEDARSTAQPPPSSATQPTTQQPQQSNQSTSNERPNMPGGRSNFWGDNKWAQAADNLDDTPSGELLPANGVPNTRPQGATDQTTNNTGTGGKPPAKNVGENVDATQIPGANKPKNGSPKGQPGEQPGAEAPEGENGSKKEDNPTNKDNTNKKDEGPEDISAEPQKPGIPGGSASRWNDKDWQQAADNLDDTPSGELLPADEKPESGKDEKSENEEKPDETNPADDADNSTPPQDDSADEDDDEDGGQGLAGMARGLPGQDDFFDEDEEGPESNPVPDAGDEGGEEDRKDTDDKKDGDVRTDTPSKPRGPASMWGDKDWQQATDNLDDTPSGELLSADEKPEG
ncbi:MAG: hypothetical protein COX81_00860, partial [Candidatus Magasanikbacteria bacterium CG_4_10_14_0_2_um_filter_37_12]